MVDSGSDQEANGDAPKDVGVTLTVQEGSDAAVSLELRVSEGGVEVAA